jgi:DNA-binding transcriptional ArsR family regulator
MAVDFCPITHNHMVVNSLDQTFVALSDLTRRNILARLRRGPATVSELAEPFSISQQAISKHLALLERAALIRKQRLGRQQYCALRPAALKEAYAWVEEYRRLWNESFDQLDELLEEMKQRKLKANRNVRKKP